MAQYGLNVECEECGKMIWSDVKRYRAVKAGNRDVPARYVIVCRTCARVLAKQ